MQLGAAEAAAAVAGQVRGGARGGPSWGGRDRQGRTWPIERRPIPDPNPNPNPHPDPTPTPTPKQVERGAYKGRHVIVIREDGTRWQCELLKEDGSKGDMIWLQVGATPNPNPPPTPTPTQV